MFKTKRISSLVSIFSIFILIISMVLSGCTKTTSTNDNTEGKKVTEITIWHTYSDTETEVFEKQVIPEFEKEYPNIKVIPTRMPYEGLKQQVIAGVSGDAAPDLMRMDIIWVPEFAKLGALEDITNYEGFKELKKQVFPGPLATNYYNGRYYGLPLNTNTKIAIYNKAVLEEVGAKEPPKTMDELVELAKKLKDKEDKWGIAIGGSHTWGMLPYFWSLGGSITDDKYTKASGYLNSPDSIKALETIASWYKEGLVGPCVLGEQPDTWGGMEGGNYLMMEDGPWYYSIVGEKALKNTVNSIMPTGKGGSVSVVGGEDLVMFKTSKNKEAAWTFMKWMLTEKPQKIMASTGLVPTNIKAANSKEVQENPFIKNYIEQLKTAKPRTPHPNWEKMSETIGLAFESVLRGERDAKSALDEAAKICDELLKEK